MLQEVLLTLSGHPSPICGKDAEALDAFPYLTGAERTLLATVGRLGELHRALRSHLTSIRKEHSSVICKAVANAVLNVQLRHFQSHIVDVEQRILLKDAGTVGAYNIVPLASVVQEFDDWRRRLEWFWDLACYVQPVEESASASTQCTGPALLNKLRLDMATGYQDIEEVATTLLIVGEQAFLRLLSCWLLTGRLPDIGRQDFFVQEKSNIVSQQARYTLNPHLVPSSMSFDTASSILFVGKTLKMLEPVLNNRGSPLNPPQSSGSAKPLMASIMGHLRTIEFPIKAVVLSSAISSIRRDLSRMLGNTVLPMHTLLHILEHIQHFFLAGRPDFMDQLIEEADKYLDLRHQQTRVSSRSGHINDLAGITMKENEVKTVMSRTWAAIESSASKHDEDDETEWAREHLHLRLTQPGEGVADDAKLSMTKEQSPSALAAIRFDDFLLATPVTLRLHLKSEFDLFLSATDQHIYSTIHAYLLAIRRAHNHTSGLWREGPFRNRASSVAQLPNNHKNTRKILATCSVAVFTLSELGSFFSTEVIEQSWTTFYTWAKQSRGSSSSAADPKNTTTTIESASPSAADLPHDPESLSFAHHAYLTALTSSLLLTDISFPRLLRSLLTFIDQTVAFVRRLHTAQANLALHAGNIADEYLLGKYAREAEFLEQEARKSCVRVDEGIVKLVERLKGVSVEEIGSGRVIGEGGVQGTGFEPWRLGNVGVERLLLRLDGEMDRFDVE